MRAWRKPRLRTVVVAVGVVAAGAAGTGGIVHARELAEVPAASASSGEVLHVYLRAAKAHECTVTEALTVPEGDARSMAWCGRSWNTFSLHPDLLSYTNIGAPTDDGPTYADTGEPERCYPVDVTETNMTGADPGDLPGWQFCLAKTAAGWRMADEGYG